MQIDKGEDYPLLHPAYFIGILDFTFGADSNYHTRHLILNKATKEHLLKDIRFACIELPKFNKEMNELETVIDRWTFFIKNSEDLQVIPDFANEDEGLNIAFLEGDKYQWTREEIIAYDNVAIHEADAIQEKLKVAENAREEMILGMQEEGLTNQQIAKITRKSEAEIAQIIEKHRN
jgi:predicted transposase/invertase (TIGR01784 family)